VNLMGVVHGIRTFLPIMIEQGAEAHIVNTASPAGLMTGGSLYGVTKSAVIALSETVHLELVGGGYKPRISVRCPGVVDTNIFDSERNRPARFAHAGPRPNGWSKEAARESFKRGLDPRAVGEQGAGSGSRGALLHLHPTGISAVRQTHSAPDDANPQRREPDHAAIRRLIGAPPVSRCRAGGR
jgi:NAD(P)-dependent dehydrogenase (short-subunit alcohol dehydrogenase family)